MYNPGQLYLAQQLLIKQLVNLQQVGAINIMQDCWELTEEQFKQLAELEED